jgi:hypothetical protein
VIGNMFLDPTPTEVVIGIILIVVAAADICVVSDRAERRKRLKQDLASRDDRK